MKVAVKYMAQLRDAVGLAYEQVELEQPCSAAGVRHAPGRPARRAVSGVCCSMRRAGCSRPILLFVGDEQVRERRSGRSARRRRGDGPVADGRRVKTWPPRNR